MKDSYGDTVRACPECDKAGLTPRQGWSRCQKGDEKYRCRFCGHRFDEPHIRKRRATSGVQGLAKKLDEMDPDDLVGGKA